MHSPSYRRRQVIAYLLGGQYANGGWPQKFPAPRGYERYITFNDNAMVGVLSLLRDVARGDPEFAWVPADLRAQCGQAELRGRACILRCLIQRDGRPTVWCAQHDEVTLRPRGARSYELPSFSGGESVGVVRYLMQIEQPDAAVVRAVEGAVAWFERYQLRGLRLQRVADPAQPKGYDLVVVNDPAAPALWARFYDLHTNEPIFCSRDGKPRRTLAEISYERRTGYSWLGPYARQLLEEEYPAWKRRLGQE